MRAHGRAVLIAAVAAAVMWVAAGPAAAGRLSFSNQSIRAVFERLDFEAGGLVIECRVILRGSFHAATLPKVAGGLYGLITEVQPEECRSGSVVVPAATLPWQQRYNGFSGFLPFISVLFMRWRAATFTVREFPIAGPCTFSGEFEVGYRTEVSATSLGTVTNAFLPKEALASAFCPARLFYRGIAPVSSPGGMNIVVTLI